jgi:hypothetical protein
LQERVEQMRLADWRKITDEGYLQDHLLARVPNSGSPLGNVSERITVSAYPDPSVASRLIVQRRPDGGREVISNGAGLTSERLAQVEFQVRWTGSDGRQRMRATTTVISNGGISRMNLPGFGSAGGAPPTSGTSTWAGRVERPDHAFSSITAPWCDD